MTPSNIMLYVSTSLFTFTVIGLAYLQLPFTPSPVKRRLKEWMSPATLIAYCTLIAATFLAAIGQ